MHVCVHLLYSSNKVRHLAEEKCPPLSACGACVQESVFLNACKLLVPPRGDPGQHSQLIVTCWLKSTMLISMQVGSTGM